MNDNNTNNNQDSVDSKVNTSSTETNSEVVSFLPSNISDIEKQEFFRELTILLTRSWEENGKKIYGCSEEELLLVSQFDIFTLQEILDEYEKFIGVLGLELKDYELDNKRFYCLRSSYYAPPELNKRELVVLGLIIALREIGKEATTQLLKEKLVMTKKFSNYQVEEALRTLVKMGYIQSIKRKWHYNYRLLVEFDESERSKIVQEYEKLW